jgi:hypothetical protein
VGLPRELISPRHASQRTLGVCRFHPGCAARGYRPAGDEDRNHADAGSSPGYIQRKDDYLEGLPRIEGAGPRTAAHGRGEAVLHRHPPAGLGEHEGPSTSISPPVDSRSPPRWTAPTTRPVARYRWAGELHADIPTTVGAYLARVGAAPLRPGTPPSDPRAAPLVRYPVTGASLRELNAKVGRSCLIARAVLIISTRGAGLNPGRKAITDPPTGKAYRIRAPTVEKSRMR